MNVFVFVVGGLALIGLAAGMVQLSAHHNGPVLRQHGSTDVAHGVQLQPPEPVWEAQVVLDPLTVRELELGQLDHGAESFAANSGMFDEYHARHREETARQFWDAGCNWYIEHINRQFDALTADLPTTGEDPFDRAYWPQVSAVPTSGLPGQAGEPITLQRLATFSPDATIQIIEERNAVPTYFSWHTQEQFLVRGHGDVQVSHQVTDQGTTTLVRERPRGGGVVRHRRHR